MKETTTAEAAPHQLAEVAQRAGVHHLRLLRVLRQAGVPLSRDASGTFAGPVALAELARRRAAAEDGFAGAEGAHPSIRRLLLALGHLEVERDTARRVAEIARATGRHAEALAIEEGLQIANEGAVVFDDPAGCWRIALPRTLPTITMHGELVTA